MGSQNYELICENDNQAGVWWAKVDIAMMYWRFDSSKTWPAAYFTDRQLHFVTKKQNSFLHCSKIKDFFRLKKKQSRILATG